jgi:hypothetical protein
MRCLPAGGREAAARACGVWLFDEFRQDDHAAFLTRGLTSAGFKVGYAKLTGTGAGNDYFGVLDSGAGQLSISRCRLASTYRTPVNVLEVTSLNLIAS